MSNEIVGFGQVYIADQDGNRIGLTIDESIDKKISLTKDGNVEATMTMTGKPTQAAIKMFKELEEEKNKVDKANDKIDELATALNLLVDFYNQHVYSIKRLRDISINSNSDELLNLYKRMEIIKKYIETLKNKISQIKAEFEDVE